VVASLPRLSASTLTPPKKCSPIAGPGIQRGLIDQSILARRERIVKHRIRAAFGEAAHLIDIAESIHKGRSPRTAAACGLGCLRDPYGRVRCIAIAQGFMRVKGRLGAGKPLFSKSLILAGPDGLVGRCATL
jgi:hypothetical protein